MNQLFLFQSYVKNKLVFFQQNNLRVPKLLHFCYQGLIFCSILAKYIRKLKVYDNIRNASELMFGHGI